MIRHIKIILTESELRDITAHKTVERDGILISRSPKSSCKNCVHNLQIYPCIQCLNYSEYLTEVK